jgi:hypothetical protein
MGVLIVASARAFASLSDQDTDLKVAASISPGDGRDM